MRPAIGGGISRGELVDELILYVAPHFLGMMRRPWRSRRVGECRRLSRFEFRDQRLIDTICG